MAHNQTLWRNRVEIYPCFTLTLIFRWFGCGWRCGGLWWFLCKGVANDGGMDCRRVDLLCSVYVSTDGLVHLAIKHRVVLGRIKVLVLCTHWLFIVILELLELGEFYGIKYNNNYNLNIQAYALVYLSLYSFKIWQNEGRGSEHMSQDKCKVRAHKTFFFLKRNWSQMSHTCQNLSLIYYIDWFTDISLPWPFRYSLFVTQ